ncbi:MAG: PLP-dependent aspartate aminotransferase family protein [Planctomycetaceae bacterium]
MHPETSADLSDATLAARGGWTDDFVTRPSAPPVYMTTAFDLDGLEQLDAVAGGTQKGYLYTRDGNPNHEAFANDVAQLERAEFGMVAASGMGALTAALVASLKTGDHVLAARVLYGRTGQLLKHLQTSFGIVVTYLDANDPAAWKAAVTSETKLAIVESVSNPLLEVADLPALVEAIGAVPLLVDNTFGTPCLIRPIELGATFVWHSASKYLNGHGDVMLGVIVGPKDRTRRIRGVSSMYGLNANPFECWLASRGLRTLPLRMERVSHTAHEIAEFLQKQPGVQRVCYPGLADHPSHALAKRLLPSGSGGMLSFELSGGKPAVESVFRALSHVIPFSPTLADARTTVSYPAGTSHKFMTAAERQACGISDGLIRLSVGLEDVADLKRELQAALENAR